MTTQNETSPAAPEDQTTSSEPAVTGGDENTVEAAPTFTQADLDRVVQTRLSRQQAEIEAGQNAINRLAEIEAAEMSELEIAQARVAELETASAQAIQKANSRLIEAAVTAAATKQGAVDIETVTKLLPADSVTVNENGAVEGAEKAVQQLLENKPFLVSAPTITGGASTNPASGNSSTGKITTRAQLSKMTPQQIMAAQADGLIDINNR